MGEIPTSAAECYLTKNTLTSCLFQRRSLCRGALPSRGAACITAQYCIKVSPIESLLQYRFATSKPLQTRQVSNRCVIASLCNRSSLFVWLSSSGFPGGFIHRLVAPTTCSLTTCLTTCLGIVYVRRIEGREVLRMFVENSPESLAPVDKKLRRPP